MEEQEENLSGWRRDRETEKEIEDDSRYPFPMEERKEAVRVRPSVRLFVRSRESDVKLSLDSFFPTVDCRAAGPRGRPTADVLNQERRRALALRLWPDTPPGAIY